MARLSKEEWSKIRKVWESDEREGYKWLIKECSSVIAGITDKAIAMRSKREEWTKKKKILVTQNVTPVTKTSNNEASSAVKIGRPTDFKEEYIDQVYRLCLLGATNEEIAEFFEVNVSTITEWRSKHQEFSAAISRGKMAADAEVAESLFERAKGYEHDSVHIAIVQGQTVEIPIIKKYPPSERAAQFWLTNRQPQKWKAKVEVKHEITNPFPSNEELDAIRAKSFEEARKREEKMRLERQALGINVSSLHEGSLQE